MQNVKINKIKQAQRATIILHFDFYFLNLYEKV